MKGFFVEKLAHPSKIQLSTDLPAPKPTGSQVLVDIYSTGLNFFDVRSLFPALVEKSIRVFKNAPTSLRLGAPMYRSSNPKGNTSTNRPSLSSLARNSQDASRGRRPSPPGARINLVSEYSALRKALSRTLSLLSGRSSFPCLTISALTRVQVRSMFL